MAEHIQLVPNRPDAEIAAEIKAKVEAVYKELLPVFDEAARNGFLVQVGVGLSSFGKFQIQNLQVLKQF